MKKKFTKFGFDVVEDNKNNIHYIDDFPQFPNKNNRSKDIFQTIEQVVLKEKHITFPMKFNMKRVRKKNNNHKHQINIRRNFNKKH